MPNTVEDDVPELPTFLDEDVVSDDGHMVLRETPPWQVRERWARVTLRKRQMELEAELDALNNAECLVAAKDVSEDIISIIEVSWLQRTAFWMGVRLEQLAVVYCQLMHPAVRPDETEQFYACPTCKRRYAVPWADDAKIGADVYVSSVPFVKPATPTRQAVCKNGTQEES